MSYMKTVATLKIKLDLGTEAASKLDATREAYVVALNMTSAVAFDRKIASGVTLHHATYRDVRAATGLPANLVCSSRAVVAEAYTRDPSRRHRFRDHSAMRYDARTLSVDLDKASVTLSTLAGRVRASLVLCDYHRRHLDGSWTFVKGATVKRSGKAWTIHLTCHRDVPESDKPGVLGVDAGIKRVATTSNAKVHKGGSISQIRRRKFRQRRELQRKTAGHRKTRGQRRLLKRLAGSENRAVEWKLWNVANAIVRDAIATDCGTIAVEDLKGIRGRIRAAKKQRLIQQGWPFASLQAKVAHVASRHGIKVESVDARNTSRTCRCGHIDKASRVNQSTFACTHCGHSLNADLNAAFNIRARYVSSRCPAVNLGLLPAG
jgi:IS605 OrfB family transposase